MSGSRAQALQVLKDGREAYWAQCADRHEARFEELEFLTSVGIPAPEAAILAGWPSLAAAAKALYRAGHPLAGVVDREYRRTHLISVAPPLT